MIGETLCSGIGAPEVAAPWVDWRLASDIDAFSRAAFTQRHGFNDARKSASAKRTFWGDFTAIRPRHYRRLGIPFPQIIVAGTPCQAFSVAGARGSLSDARGNLTLAFARHVHAIRKATANAARPLEYVVWENVPGVLNTADNAFGCFLAALVGADGPIPPARDGGGHSSVGMVASGGVRIAWRVLDAQYFGVPQRRRRVFVVVGFGERADPAQIFFERKSLHGNTAPRRKKRKAGEIAPTLGARAGRGGGFGTDFDLDGGLIAAINLRGRDGGAMPECDPDGLASLRAASGGSSRSYIAFHESQDPNVSGDVTHPLGRNYGQEACIANGYSVRRLMPIECERLQGFPDGFTEIEWRGKPAPDGRRYSALGNSMAVPVVRWILDRIKRQAEGVCNGK